MRLSYLRYALKTTSDPRGLLERGTEELHLSPKFQSLLEPFVPAVAKHNETLNANLVMALNGGRLVFPDREDIGVPAEFDGAVLALVFP
jgi:hypothetical protein